MNVIDDDDTDSEFETDFISKAVDKSRKKFDYFSSLNRDDSLDEDETPKSSPPSSKNSPNVVSVTPYKSPGTIFDLAAEITICFSLVRTVLERPHFDPILSRNEHDSAACQLNLTFEK